MLNNFTCKISYKGFVMVCSFLLQDVIYTVALPNIRRSMLHVQGNRVYSPKNCPCSSQTLQRKNLRHWEDESGHRASKWWHWKSAWWLVQSLNRKPSSPVPEIPTQILYAHSFTQSIHTEHFSAWIKEGEKVPCVPCKASLWGLTLAYRWQILGAELMGPSIRGSPDWAHNVD